MYIPKQFRVSDMAEVVRFMREHSFATLVSVKGGAPVATHIPLEVEENEDGTFCLAGHLSKANEQWKTLEANPQVLAIFSGPHSYISSSWYDHVNVPTWNYMAVHVSGNAEVIAGEQLVPFLTRQVNKYEAGSEHPMRMDHLTDEYLSSHLKGIVGIKITVTDVQAAYKLSQNRDSKNLEQIISELEKIGTDNSMGVAEAMKKNRK